MVKLVASLIAITTLLPWVCSAAACTDGLSYCGYNLLKRGSYAEEIKAELEREGIPVDSRHINYSQFRCGVGGHGWIRFISYCENGCRDAGSGRNDYCVNTVDL